MRYDCVKLPHKDADGYVIPCGPVNLVMIATDIGLVSCGLIDVAMLDRFDYPAARAKSATGALIATIDDLLGGIIKETNTSAQDRGIRADMPVREALALL